MRISSIRKLIKAMEDSPNIGKLEVLIWWPSKIWWPFKWKWMTVIKITKDNSSVISLSHKTIERIAAVPASNPEIPIKTAPCQIVIKSPWIGIFHSKVKVGQSIAIGQVIGIITSLNSEIEIKSEVAGKVTKICVGNAKPVDFGKVLFEIEPIN
jgi:biotin carboxyl carrier protein